jgi:hypothetical protein
MRVGFALDDNEDGGSDSLLFASGDHADPSFRAQLVVTYTP